MERFVTGLLLFCMIACSAIRYKLFFSIPETKTEVVPLARWKYLSYFNQLRLYYL